jgi:PTH1 family peptidyl-tRNA hydrolase
MTETRIRLVAGLGNPGSDYAETRHNAGFMVVDDIADEYDIPISKSKFNVHYGTGNIGNEKVLLAKPQSFMNRVGQPVKKLAEYFEISGEEMLVIHDDIDLAFERLKIKMKGGHGGHNGVRSLIEAFGGGNFARLRVGIGRPEGNRSVTDQVLGRFSKDEKIILERIITLAKDAAVTILCYGIQEGMNRFNQKHKALNGG